jgi:hypothetical protein
MRQISDPHHYFIFSINAKINPKQRSPKLLADHRSRIVRRWSAALPEAEGFCNSDVRALQQGVTRKYLAQALHEVRNDDGHNVDRNSR